VLLPPRMVCLLEVYKEKQAKGHSYYEKENEMKKLILIVALLSGCGGHKLMYKQTCEKHINYLSAECDAYVDKVYVAYVSSLCNNLAQEKINCKEKKMFYDLSENCDQFLSSTTVQGLLRSGLIKSVK
jgi:hypothetical protein